MPYCAAKKIEQSDYFRGGAWGGHGGQMGSGSGGGSSYPDVIVVLQAVLHVVQELADVQLAQAALQQ